MSISVIEDRLNQASTKALTDINANVVVWDYYLLAKGSSEPQIVSLIELQNISKAPTLLVLQKLSPDAVEAIERYSGLAVSCVEPGGESLLTTKSFNLQDSLCGSGLNLSQHPDGTYIVSDGIILNLSYENLKTDEFQFYVIGRDIEDLMQEALALKKERSI